MGSTLRVWPQPRALAGDFAGFLAGFATLAALMGLAGSGAAFFTWLGILGVAGLRLGASSVLRQLALPHQQGYSALSLGV